MSASVASQGPASSALDSAAEPSKWPNLPASELQAPEQSLAYYRAMEAEAIRRVEQDHSLVISIAHVTLREHHLKPILPSSDEGQPSGDEGQPSGDEGRPSGEESQPSGEEGPVTWWVRDHEYTLVQYDASAFRPTCRLAPSHDVEATLNICPSFWSAGRVPTVRADDLTMDRITTRSIVWPEEGPKSEMATNAPGGAALHTVPLPSNAPTDTGATERSGRSTGE